MLDEIENDEDKKMILDAKEISPARAEGNDAKKLPLEPVGPDTWRLGWCGCRREGCLQKALFRSREGRWRGWVAAVGARGRGLVSWREKRTFSRPKKLLDLHAAKFLC